MSNIQRLSKATSYIVYLSSYPPRECGIATFTQDLALAMDKKYNPAVKSKVAAINEEPSSIYHYDNKVLGELSAVELQDYVELAKKINAAHHVKLVNIQHEFGLFGGKWGDYLVPFLQALEKPVVTTLHSVLPNPDDHLKKTTCFIALRSKALVVMNKFSQHILERDYGIPRSKTYLVPHGIPATAFDAPHEFKKELGLDGRTVLSTFGLLSPNKGIEYVIRALPKVVKKFPQVVYLVLGVTHPTVRKYAGESYRNFLIREVDRLGLKNCVKFYNKYLTSEEIVAYLKASDIYISPNIDERQSVSGTMSYALGCGRPVISTKTAYATYVINGKNGVLVNSRKPNELTDALNELLDDPRLLKSMSMSAYENSRQMIWPNIAASYFKVFQKCARLHGEERKLPKIKFDHVIRLTDNFGVLHFAKYSKPEKRYGYSLDDNARALIATVGYYRLTREPELLQLIKKYLDFVKFVQRPSGSFANIVSFYKKKDATSDEDVQGRGVWALGYTASAYYLSEGIRLRAQKMFEKSLRRVPHLTSPRAIAFAMTGLYFYLKHAPSGALLKTFKKLADRQVDYYKKIALPEWQWFENHLTYSNSKLPESLYYAYGLIRDRKYLEVAEKTLEFLRNITFEKGHYAPIGQNGWYFRNKKRSYFDQQPEDAASMAQTEIVAYKMTRKRYHLDHALKAFYWFLGENHLNQMVYDEVAGGCHDGIGRDTLNLNQGAESTISYLIARLGFEDPDVKSEL